MAQRLFALNKIPVFLVDYQPGTERRRGETVKVMKLSLKVQPFDSKMAHAVDEGLDNESGVKDALFRASDGQPKKHRSRVVFDLGCAQQNLIMYASTDTPTSRMAFAQCRIGGGAYVRTSKNVNAYAFCFTATFGPVGRDEMEFLHHWLGSQLAVTFEESEEQIPYDAPPVDKKITKKPQDKSQPPLMPTDKPDGKQIAADKNREQGHNYPKKGKAKKAARPRR